MAQRKREQPPPMAYVLKDYPKTRIVGYFEGNKFIGMILWEWAQPEFRDSFAPEWRDHIEGGMHILQVILPPDDLMARISEDCEVDVTYPDSVIQEWEMPDGTWIHTVQRRGYRGQYWRKISRATLWRYERLLNYAWRGEMTPQSRIRIDNDVWVWWPKKGCDK